MSKGDVGSEDGSETSNIRTDQRCTGDSWGLSERGTGKKGLPGDQGGTVKMKNGDSESGTGERRDFPSIGEKVA